MLKKQASKSSISSKSNSIKVVCRFRPPRNADNISPFTISSESNAVTYVSSERKTFTFDRIFDVQTSQDQIFTELKEVVEGVIDGVNGTILAYGQTSAGKSWTMDGILDDASLQGVVPRSVDLLFSAVEKAPAHIHFHVIISYYEIYCEKLVLS